MTKKAFRFVVKGKVQGVGYRAFTQRVARQLGLVGFVQNEVDGSVTGVAEGPVDDLNTLFARLEVGPPSARVQSVDLTREPSTGLASFDVRR